MVFRLKLHFGLNVKEDEKVRCRAFKGIQKKYDSIIKLLRKFGFEWQVLMTNPVVSVLISFNPFLVGDIYYFRLS